jgi:NAD(P)-dependent dehydrogenase (short-subunit alcohol dehydrogenase family)
MAYSVTKAAQIHLMKCMASTQGPKIRINAVLPGLLLTEWGLKYSEERQKYLKETAALKHEVSRIHLAVVKLTRPDIFGRLCRSIYITGQEHLHDGTSCVLRRWTLHQVIDKAVKNR